MPISSEDVEAGQAVYSRRVLGIYDILVLGLSNRWIWKCPTKHLLEHYNRCLSSNHLDVGVGTRRHEIDLDSRSGAPCRQLEVA